MLHKRRHRQPANSISRKALHKGAAVNFVMSISVVQVKYFLLYLNGLFHGKRIG